MSENFFIGNIVVFVRMRSKQELEALSIDELRAYRDSIASSNNSLNNDIAQLENDISITTRENEEHEGNLMNNYQQKIINLRTQNVVVAKKLQKEEEFVANGLKNRLRDVMKENEELEERLKTEENFVIDKLMGEINKLKGTELMLEAQLADVVVPLDTNTVDPELDELYQESVNKKNELSMEYIALRLEVERLITSNNILSQRIASAQMEVTLKKPNKGNVPPMRPTPSRRFTIMPGSKPQIQPHKKKRRVSHNKPSPAPPPTLNLGPTAPANPNGPPPLPAPKMTKT
ncbi:hypothetical protein TRFO_06309 [Tritrichomonas foetus]|uniref:Uncharacterized protein n=1 Tax=Tritrichomonas foetus TaxID=1144522 RepID=A0A1J4K0F1_9EUKA|nr:hypothetical protein TRFO_06309 [Tritrichomonas foetus]|eukprot:OHT04426.1 hypothetical protein TRFO_06309 [Tritrichomonas foetus]